MNLVAILAGGVGRRMNGGVLPKQFIEVKGVPIIITTLKKCLNVKKIDIIYIAIHPSYKDYLLELIQTYDIKKDKIKLPLFLIELMSVSSSGKRLVTLYNAFVRLMMLSFSI